MLTMSCLLIRNYTASVERRLWSLKDARLWYESKMDAWGVHVSTSSKSTMPSPGQPPASTSPSCTPRHRLVFIKTHKTGSSTITTILERFGYIRDLNFALPSRRHFFVNTAKFHASWVYRVRPKNRAAAWPGRGEFHIVANHARYNRRAMDELIANATYFTIIREPAAQFESVFGYFKVGRSIPGNDSLQTFLKDPDRYYAKASGVLMGLIKNGQMFDLGFDAGNVYDMTAVNKTIASLATEMDLVMINEYFDESLVLLRKLLCWDMDDIVYIAKNVRKRNVRRTLTPDLRDKILQWNRGDALLYLHFNQTFWRKVKDYGPDFWRDLEAFRQLKNKTNETCMKEGKHRWDLHRTNVITPSKNASEKCKDLMREDMDWVRVLRRRLTEKSINISTS